MNGIDRKKDKRGNKKTDKGVKNEETNERQNSGQNVLENIVNRTKLCLKHIESIFALTMALHVQFPSSS